MESKISGVILAGGTNQRFGGITKANVVIGGKTIISRMVSTIGNLFDEIIIVTNKPEEFREYAHYMIVGDRYLKAGPLGGIHAALKTSTRDAIFVFAGDMPFLDEKIISEQIEKFNKGEQDVLVPELDHHIEPLHAIYSKSVLIDLERFVDINKDKAVRDFLDRINVGYLHLRNTRRNKRAFTNINSQSDLSEATRHGFFY